MFRRGFAILLAAIVSSSAAAASESLYFSAVDVFDGEKNIAATNVLIADGKIAAIGADVQPSEGAATIDRRGKTLLPGMIDCHTHTFFEEHLKQAAVFGVTTELDMMAAPFMAAVFRQQQAGGKADHRADFFSAGAAVTVKGGHGTQFGFPVPTLDSADGAAEFVARRVREGSDYIKLIYEDGSPYGLSFPTLSKEMFAAAVAAAHEHDKQAVAHVSTAEGARLAIDLGVDGLVHLFADEKISEELVASMKSKGVFVVPTASVVSNASGSNRAEIILADEHLQPLLTNSDKANLAKTFPQRAGAAASWSNLKYNIAKLHQAGVPMLAGSDAPNPGTAHGAAMHQELRLLVESGLTDAAALAAATSAAADAFALDDRGRIAAGLRADLVLVEGDPAADVKNAARILGVWKAGRPIDRAERIKQVEKESQSK